MKNPVMVQIRYFTAAALLAATNGFVARAAERPFAPVATYTVSGLVAEIIAATPDGGTLIYTDSASQVIGLVDVNDPANPGEAGTVAVAGEPTSVAVTPNGSYALAVVHGTPDHLVVIDLNNITAAPVIRTLGGQPDSIAISPDGRYAAIVIENERDETVNGGEMPQSPAGFVTIVDLVGPPAGWNLRDVSLLNVADRFPTDPEPEFVDINANNQAAVTLQENNHIVIIDLPSGIILNDFTAGLVSHRADLLDDEKIRLSDLLEDSRREPDGIHWTAAGNLVVANEGDYDLDVDFVGGRGFTIFNPAGGIVFESGAELEREVVRAGCYDDSRSDAKGTEPEGVEIANFGGKSYLFVGMERAKPGAVAVYLLKKEANPEFLQVLQTGSRPEGLLALPQRDLFVTANEGNGTISIFGRK
jgi:DNA-binding beta-propeller fold protein YncE